jgi:hypothetical protein
MLKGAYFSGSDAALAHLKLAGPMGADHAPTPTGDGPIHGTELIPYAKRDSVNDGNKASLAGSAVSNMPSWLWDNFTTYDKIAPGRSDGTFGQETIG